AVGELERVVRVVVLHLRGQPADLLAVAGECPLRGDVLAGLVGQVDGDRRRAGGGQARPHVAVPDGPRGGGAESDDARDGDTRWHESPTPGRQRYVTGPAGYAASPIIWC